MAREVRYRINVMMESGFSNEEISLHSVVALLVGLEDLAHTAEKEL